ncbi:hypothetical protein HJC23_005497 [Cyclotella cryptica]|uniref:Tyrosine-protein kinase ephrin type A/B receptor-like domain-containing protein n=1 Tax=Cyclotella cryptica TaxID=29204 RepID=A0ABD3PH15_9STRA
MHHKQRFTLTTIITAPALTQFVLATQEQCYIDCHSSPRPIGPTRPWNDTDALRDPLHLTRPYPYYVTSTDDEQKYAVAEFCNLGCNYFFVSSGAGQEADTENDTSSTLDRCIRQCDENFTYNITVGYSDLLEMARLECRDGCQMALKRCQPGYYCSQVSFDADAHPDPYTSILENQYSGGTMIPCPAGTYREVSYDAVTECLPCPSNHYREDIKGKSPADCAKCPRNTSSRSGSISVKDCIRCPAGTFSVEAGSCECITPRACDKNQLPSPADAEKKDTVPYIGRW